MIEKVRETILQYRMLVKGETVLVAVSGGADSMTLLHLLRRLAGEFEVELVVAHFNHGLRWEADREAEFVRQAAEKMGLPFILGHEDVKKLQKSWGRSLEEAARIARYRFLDAAAKNYGAKKIALGHHRLDQAETVLINIIRGSGLSGLKGMEPLRDGRYIRPLIYVSPQEIGAYIAREGIEYCTDRSNFDESFLRNRVRHRLIPLLKREFNPRIVDILSQMADILREEEEFLACETEGILNDWTISCEAGSVIPLPGLRALPVALRRRVLKNLLARMRPAGKAVTFRHVKAVENIALSTSPGQIVSVPGGCVVKEYDRLVFLPKELAGKHEDFSYALPLPGEVRIEATGQIVRADICDIIEVPSNPAFPNILYVDLAMLKPPLKVRNWRNGDRMVPLGMDGSRKIQDIMGEMKVPRIRRRLIPLLEDAGGILWVGGIKIAERCRLKPDTKQVARIEIV